MRLASLLTLFLHLTPVAPASALLPDPPPREFRGAWVTPVLGFDWPTPTRNAKAQQHQFTEFLDSAKAVGINAIILHVRVAGDALYVTQRAPWSAYLTGKQGRSPGYDPLAFAIREAHARGLQLHAWFNPFRATPSPAGTKAATLNILRRHPAWIVRYGSERWINPGIPAARKAVLNTIFEVVENYDIDGVHIDDFFYPYRQDRVGEFNDPVSFRKYGKPAGFKDRASWRRDNINRFVKALYAGVHERKPWLPVGISPFGIWKSGVPAGLTGLDAYSEIFADSRLWLREGWLDYIAPQLYWPFDTPQQRFTRLLDWWQTQNEKGRYIWPGLAAFLAHHPNWQPGDLIREIEAIRSAEGTNPGHVHFHLRSALTRAPFYDDFALVPAMPWLSSRKPVTPAAKTHKLNGDSVDIRLAPAAANVRWLLVQTMEDSAWQSQVVFKTSKLRVARDVQTVVTAISRTGMLGERVVVNGAP